MDFNTISTCLTNNGFGAITERVCCTINVLSQVIKTELWNVFLKVSQPVGLPLSVLSQTIFKEVNMKSKEAHFHPMGKLMLIQGVISIQKMIYYILYGSTFS